MDTYSYTVPTLFSLRLYRLVGFKHDDLGEDYVLVPANEIVLPSLTICGLSYIVLCL